MADTSLKFRVNCSSGIPLAALGAIALVTGIIFHSAAAVALGAVLVAGPVLVYLALRHSIKALAVRRLAPIAAFEGENVEVRMTLENKAWLPIFFPEVSEVFAPEIHAQKDILFPERLPAGETTEGNYEGICLLPRGCYSLGPTAVRITDPFGWFQAHKYLEGRHAIKVYPRVQDFGVSEKVGECRTYLTTPRIHFGVGESEEFFSVREYQRGDALRRIHWGLTAHRGSPVVREFARVTKGDLCIFVDTYRQGLIGVGRSSSLEHAVKIAVALSARALRRGHRVKFVAGSDPKLHLPFGSGSHHLQRLLDILVQVKPAGGEPLPHALSKHAHEIDAGSTVVVMLAPYLFGSAELEAQLLSWRFRGARVLAIIFDAGTFRNIWEAPATGGNSQVWARQLKAHGLETYLIPCAADLRAIFRGQAAGGAV